MRKPVYLIFVTITVIFFTNYVYSDEIPLVYKSIRAMAMGDAFNSFCDDISTIIYNPAGLSMVSHLRINCKPILGGGNEFFPELWELIDKGDIGEYLSGADKKTIGGSGALLNTAVVLPTDSIIGSLGAGYFYTGYLKGEVDPGIFVPNMYIYGAIDTVVVLSISQKISNYIKLFPGTYCGGIGINLIQRKKINGFFSFFSIDETVMENFIKNGSGIGVTLAGTYQFEGKEEFLFSGIIKDVGCTTLKWNDGTSSYIPWSCNLGVSYRPGVTKSSYDDYKLTLTADLNDIFSGGDFFNKFHLGAEYKFPIVTPRIGFNKGWFTYGFRILGFIEYAHFQEELGSFAGAMKEEWNYLGLSFGF